MLSYVHYYDSRMFPGSFILIVMPCHAILAFCILYSTDQFDTAQLATNFDYARGLDFRETGYETQWNDFVILGAYFNLVMKQIKKSTCHTVFFLSSSNYPSLYVKETHSRQNAKVFAT